MRRLFVAALLLSSCGGAASQSAHVPQQPVVVARGDAFASALAAFASHETRDDWSVRSCTDVAAAFDAVGTAIAVFDAGTTLERCADHAGAAARFERAAALDPKLVSARIELVLARYEETKDVNAAVQAMDRVVVDTAYHDPRALVEPAALELKRRGPGDVDAARTNLGRALALDDGNMVALDRLALLYLETGHAEMAALVVSQAIDRGSRYAPLFNTAGLVQNALGKPSLAAHMFQRATELDPKLFEAHVNLANLNLSFRGFARAEEAFRAALRLRPNDYDAHLGLALALRGQITDVTAEKVAAVREELATCMKLDPSRPDAYFNDGILAQEFDVKVGANPKPALARALVRFDEFKARAAGRAAYADALKRADERITDAIATRDFFP